MWVKVLFTCNDGFWHIHLSISNAVYRILPHVFIQLFPKRKCLFVVKTLSILWKPTERLDTVEILWYMYNVVGQKIIM